MAAIYVADGMHWAIKVDLVHLVGDVLCVGPVPQETSLLDNHVWRVKVNGNKDNFDRVYMNSRLEML